MQQRQDTQVGMWNLLGVNTNQISPALFDILLYLLGKLNVSMPIYLSFTQFPSIYNLIFFTQTLSSDTHVYLEFT